MSNQNADSSSTNKTALSEEYASGWLTLTKNESVQYVIDALLDSSAYREFNKSELAEQAGVSRQSVIRHVGQLVELGILEPVEGTNPTRYRFNQESPVSEAIINVDATVSMAPSGDT